MKTKQMWLIKLRKAKGFKTQTEFSEKLGISKNYYCEIENGRPPSGRIAYLIAQELGFDMSLFFGTGVRGMNNKTA